MFTKLLITFSIILSITCMLLSAAPFSPAIAVSFLMLLVAGIFGIKGYIQTGLMLLLINTLAVIGSPDVDISNLSSLTFMLIIFSVGFGGVMWGVRKFQLQLQLQTKHNLNPID